MLDKIRLILVEGANDSSFISWLLAKNSITLNNNKKLIAVSSKHEFKKHIKGIVGKDEVKLDEKIVVDYSQFDVEKILIIKDCDLDDKRDQEFSNYKKLAKGIPLECHYICGEDEGTLETFIIKNNGERLKLFKQHIEQFESYVKNCGSNEPKLEKTADKQIFQSYLKFTVEKIKYDFDNFDKLLDYKKLSQTPEVTELIKLIKEF